MTTTLEAIYEDGIFKPLSSVPAALKENERVRITVEIVIDQNLKDELGEWESASDEDFLKFEKSIGENS